MVIFASVAQISTGALLVGGAIPGVLLGLSQMGLVYLIARHRNFRAAPPTEYTRARVFAILKDALPAVFMPVLLMGGILSGAFTPRPRPPQSPWAMHCCSGWLCIAICRSKRC